MNNVDKIVTLIKLAYEKGVNEGRDHNYAGLDFLALLQKSTVNDAIKHLEKNKDLS
jgi:hypothetical protein